MKVFTKITLLLTFVVLLIIQQVNCNPLDSELESALHIAKRSLLDCKYTSKWKCCKE